MISDYHKHTLSVSWLWPQQCISSFVCETLTGNTCGDYGIHLDYREQSRQRVCHVGSKHHGVLNFNEVLNIGIWMIPGAKFQASCFFWCTEDGKLPKDLSEPFIDQDLITAIVRK